MRYSDIDICNRALSLLNQRHITSFEEETKEAYTCKFLYPMVKSEVLISNIWKACYKTIRLGCLKSLSTNEFSHKFLLPSDCLRIIDVNSNNDYFMKAQYIYLNSASANVRYIANLDVEHLPVDLLYLVSLKLATEISFSLNNDKDLYKILLFKYEEEYRKLANKESKEGIRLLDEDIFESSWLKSRE